jgi:hypothetical protein
MSTNKPTYTKATLHLRESVDAPWLKNIAIEGKPGATGEQGYQGATGKPGKDGLNGANGKTFVPSIRETESGVFVDFATAEGDAIQGIVNIKGEPGKDGAPGKDGLPGKDGADGRPGRNGVDGKDGTDGEDGAPGKSAYDIAKENGYEGSEAEYYQDLANVPSLATQASTSASNASKNAEQAKTSENNAKTTADSLSAGLATLNSFDSRVGTLETQVAPTLAGGLLDVQLGHNAMVRVCEFGKVGRATATELVKPFGYTLSSGSDINCTGVGNVWMLHFGAAKNVAFICDSNLNYKTAIDVYNEFYDEVPRPNGLPIAGYSSGFTGRCWAVNADSSRIYNVMPEFRSATSTTPQAFVIQSWSLVEEYELDESGKVKLDANGKKIVKYAVGQKIAVKKHALREERLNMKLALNLTYLTNAKMVCVGADILLNQDTLELVGYVDDVTTQAGNVSVTKNRYIANQAYAKKSGFGTTFNGKRIVVYYGDDIAPIYVDDLTDPSKPTLRNFVDASGKVVTQAYSHFACAELNNSWANQQTYLMRIVSNKLVTRRVEITFPSETVTMSMVVADEKTSGVDLSGYVSIITSQGFFNTSLNKNQVLAIIAYGGAIVQQVTIDSSNVVSPSMPAIDTMTNQSDMKAKETPKFSRQTDYGVIITQSGAVGALGNGTPSISVILNRPTK